MNIFLLVILIIVCILFLIFLSFRIFYALNRSRLRKRIRDDLILLETEKPVSERICLLNIFWDLGADANAFNAIHELGLVTQSWDKITPDAGKTLKKFISRYGGYYEFLAKVSTFYGKDIKEIKPTKLDLGNSDHLERIESISEVDTSVSGLLDNLGVTGRDFSAKSKNLGLVVIGDMTGLPILEIKLATKLPSLAKTYYRINFQTGSRTSALFRTADDIASDFALGVTGNVIGLGSGAILGELVGDSLDLDGDSLEAMLILTAGAIIGSIITGKIFKAIGKWWKTRTYRKLQKEFDELLSEFVQHCAQEDIWGKIVDNGYKPVQYWIDSHDRLLEDAKDFETNKFNEEQRQNAGVFHVLWSETIKEFNVIIESLNDEVDRFFQTIEFECNKDRFVKVGQLLLFQNRILLEGVSGVKEHSSKIKMKFNEIAAEIKILKAKGVLGEAAK